MSNWERGVQTWSEVEAFLISEADTDLAHGVDIRPCMVAFSGDQPLFVAFLRSFDKGKYADPIIELLALAGPLGADRLAVSFGARAWSFDDPVPPVVPGVGDLRQRVLTITTAEERDGEVQVAGALVPFTCTGEETQWEPPLREPGEGWIPSALRLAVAQRADLATSGREVRRQARRCVALGHLLALSEVTAERLDVRGVSLG